MPKAWDNWCSANSSRHFLGGELWLKTSRNHGTLPGVLVPLQTVHHIAPKGPVQTCFGMSPGLVREHRWCSDAQSTHWWAEIGKEYHHKILSDCLHTCAWNINSGKVSKIMYYISNSTNKACTFHPMMFHMLHQRPIVYTQKKSLINGSDRWAPSSVLISMGKSRIQTVGHRQVKEDLLQGLKIASKSTSKNHVNHVKPILCHH